MSLLELDVRRKQFGAVPVLRALSASIAEGEVVALVGASGCGKSTLLRIAAGLEPDYEGEVRLAGRVVRGLTREIGFVFQEPRLFPWLTVGQNVAFDLGGDARRGGRYDPRVGELLAEVGLAGCEDALPKQLSGGQAQRVAIARGLFTRPRVLLLDEPFSAVDAFTRMKLQDLLLDVARRHGTTLLLVTHDIDEAVYLADRVLVMQAAPGTVSHELSVPLVRPRERGAADLAAARSRVLGGLYAVHAL